ncbi:MAG: metallophosphoesterase [Candidatus Hodarchaeales archaeon]
MDKKRIIEMCLQFNFNLAPDALDHLVVLSPSEKQMVNFLKNISTNKPVITLQKIQSEFEAVTAKKIDSESKIRDFKKKTVPEKRKFKVEISIERDIPFKLPQEPNIKAFREIFIQRYHQLSQMILKNISPEISIFRRNLHKDRIPPSRNGILIGMVQDTGVLHTNRFVIFLEDPITGKTTKCVIVQEPPSFPEYRNIIRDTVIGIIGVLPKNFIEGEIKAFWGRDIIRPSFKNHHFEPKDIYSRVLCISDIHYGSKNFAGNLFSKLIEYLNGRIQINENSLNPESIDTIIILGNLIEGVKHSRNDVQHDIIESFDNQYQLLSEALRKIPNRIKIIVIPGEKDASQMVIPQPAIDKKVAKSLYSLPNVQNHGNPLRLTINGMKFLIYGGHGYKQIFQDRLKLKSNDLIKGIEDLLEYRHLYPEYGSFISLAPYSKDYLVIDDIPDIVVTGHLHKANHGIYKGIRIVNCGTFVRTGKENEDLSSLGVFPIIETGTGEIEMLDLKNVKY